MDPALIRFTILTAIKNGFAQFRETVPTVLAQSDRDFEWIIVDDGSSPALTAEFPELNRDPRVKILRRSPGQGQTRALNLGIREARGEWIVRMDGDDLCAPSRLAAIRAALANRTEAQVLFSDYHVIDGAGRTWAEVRMREPLSAAFFRYLEHRNNPICHPTAAFRRHKKNGILRQFREDIVNAQDYALWREILQESGPAAFVHLGSPEVGYRIVRDSLSGARALEQDVEKRAIRDGKFLREGQQSRPLLDEAQKDAMQAYRLLYYRFVGSPFPAPVADDLSLLRATRFLPALFPKALFFLLLRPVRKPLLKFLFNGIYR